MPLANRTVLPSWLGRRAIADEDSTEDTALTAAAHNAVLGTIVQLASLVRHADDIFCDLAEECQLVFEKTESICLKVKALDRAVKQLDSTEVNIPVGTLEQFSAVPEHHVARHGFDCDHFTPGRRPHCVRFSYSQCETTPVHALRGADLYRKDGQSGPFLFKLWPIALRDVGTPMDAGGEDLSPARSFPALADHRRKKAPKLRQRPKTIHGIDNALLKEAQALADGGDLADRKLDSSLSQSQPSVLVSVDTSGAGFERMASFRQSQRGLHGTIDRKRRRRTVTGVPSNIMQEIEQFEQERRIDRSGHRKYSLEDLDPLDLDARDKVMQQYLLEIDAAREEREELAYAEQREGKLLKFLPCRRSRSLPRCVHLVTSAPEAGGGGGSTRRSKRFSKSPLASLSRLSLYTKRSQSNGSQKCTEEDDDIRLEPRQTSAVLAESRRFSSNASLGSSASSGAGRTARSLVRRGSRSSSLKRHSLIGEKLRSLVSNTLLRPRPKSLDLDAIEYREDKDSPSRIAASSPSVAVCGSGHEGSRKGRSKRDHSGERSSSLSRVSGSTAAKDSLKATRITTTASVEPSPAASRESHVGPGSYYYFDSNHTLPRAQARKYDFPWDSLPKDWTTSVKLREISKRRKEDRQSSSGNWSQSNFSSNRQSLESEAAKSCSVGHGSTSRLSQHSQGRDSGRGSPRSLRRSRHDLDPGYMGDAASTESVVSSSSTTADGSSTVAEGSSCSGDDWLRALAERAASRGDVTSTSAEALVQLSRVTRQNIQNLDLLVPGRKRKQQSVLPPPEMDNESVYSLDQEGFYTSFHNDSGLRKSSTELLDAETEEEKQESLSHYEFDDDLILSAAEIRGSKSLQSMSSTSTLGSIVFRPQLDKDPGLSSTSVSSPDLACFSRAKKSNQPVDLYPENKGLIPDSASNEAESNAEGGDAGTFKTRKKPPPPPPRSSSIGSSSITNDNKLVMPNQNMSSNKRHSSSSLESSVCSNGIPQATESSPHAFPPASSSPDEGSDHETIYARLKMKTSISVHTFPSWCTGLVSDEEDLVSLRDNLLSASHERLHAEASEMQEMFNKSHVGNFLHNSTKAAASPFTTASVALDDLDFPANSWPRGKRQGGGVTTPFLQPGILKTPEKDKIMKGSISANPKTLNFDPVVNLFDAQTPHSVQMPLSYLSSSDESGSSPPSSGTGNKPRLVFAPPVHFRGNRGGSKDSKELTAPYASSTPAQEKYQGKVNQMQSKHNLNQINTTSNTDSYSQASTNGPDISGSCTSISSINSLDAADAGHMSSLTGSCSTIALSDVDSCSLTHVSLDEVDGNCNSSPASSTLSLNWDTDGTPNPTPAATPARSRALPSGHTSAPDINSGEDNSGSQADSNKTAEAFPSGERALSYNARFRPNLTHLNQVPSTSLPIASNTSQSKFTPTAQVPNLPDSCPSSASLTPTLTPNPASIPPMKPIDANYISGGSIATLRSSDNNNNKASFFNFPERVAAQMAEVAQNFCHQKTLQSRETDQSSQNPPASAMAGCPSPSSSNRRRSSPADLHRENNLLAHTPAHNADQRDRNHNQRFDRGHDMRNFADTSFGPLSGQNQPRLAVQPFLHTPTSSTPSPSSSVSNHIAQPPKVFPTYTHKQPIKAMPFIKQQLLQEANTNNNKLAPKQAQTFTPGKMVSEKHQNIVTSRDSLHGSRHSSQESLSSQQSGGSTSHLVPKICKTDLSHPSIRRGTSSESLHSNSSAGRSDSYRVALLAEADQISVIQKRKLVPPEKGRTARTASLNEKSMSNHSIDRSRSSSLTSNQALLHSTPTSSYSNHPHLSKSMSAPVATNKGMKAMDNQNMGRGVNSKFNMKNHRSVEEEPVSRADSYRCAMRSSQSALLLGDVTGRNSSYRLATHDEDDDGGIVVNLGSGNNRMDACNSWAGVSGTSRDVRRMGITDVDQLKDIGNGGRSSADTQHVRKKFGVRPEGAGTAGSSGDPKRLRQQGSNGGIPGVVLRDKNNKQQKLQSSSYIRFDPIFESGEDLRASKESLRPPSIVSVRTLAMTGSKETLVSDTRSRSPGRRKSAPGGRRGSGNEAEVRNGGGLSILGSIKTTIKSIGGGGKGE